MQRPGLGAQASICIAMYRQHVYSTGPALGAHGMDACVHMCLKVYTASLTAQVLVYKMYTHRQLSQYG